MTKGSTHSPETREKMRRAKLGRPGNALGSRRSMEMRQRMSEMRRGISRGPTPLWIRDRISAAKKGKRPTIVYTPELRKKLSQAHRGPKAYNWIADRSQLTARQQRNDSAYVEWRKEVRNRDRWICQIADEHCTGKVVAHHILSWSDFPELRYEINNGITLCRYHHPNTRFGEMMLEPLFQELVMQAN